MKKTSIFSKNYEKNKRKRKLIKVSLFGTIIIFTIAGTGIVFNKVEDENLIDKKTNIEDGKLEEQNLNIKEDEEKSKKENFLISKNFEINGLNIIVERNLDGKIILATTANKDILLDISPNNEKLLISDDINSKKYNYKCR